MLQKFSTLFFLGMLAALSVQVVTNAVATSERNECQTWHDQSARLPRWYATEWQVAQCRQYGINLSNK